VNVESATSTHQNNAAVVQTMNDAPTTPDKNLTSQIRDTAIKKVAVVQCEGFRCLAYRDAEIWRDFQSGKELPEVKSVVFEFPVEPCEFSRRPEASKTSSTRIRKSRSTEHVFSHTR
jgi:hypothetical protein